MVQTYLVDHLDRGDLGVRWLLVGHVDQVDPADRVILEDQMVQWHLFHLVDLVVLDLLGNLEDLLIPVAQEVRRDQMDLEVQLLHFDQVRL